jgi:hypothetical protein
MYLTCTVQRDYGDVYHSEARILAGEQKKRKARAGGDLAPAKLQVPIKSIEPPG